MAISDPNLAGSETHRQPPEIERPISPMDQLRRDLDHALARIDKLERIVINHEKPGT